MDLDATLIWHIAERADWAVAQRTGRYRTASLERQGFIHASEARQVAGTLTRLFTGRGDVLLLGIDPARLSVPLRREAADGDVYPHIYGPVDVDAVKVVSAPCV